MAARRLPAQPVRSGQTATQSGLARVQSRLASVFGRVDRDGADRRPTDSPPRAEGVVRERAVGVGCGYGVVGVPCTAQLRRPPPLPTRAQSPPEKRIVRYRSRHGRYSGNPAAAHALKVHRVLRGTHQHLWVGPCRSDRVRVELTHPIEKAAATVAQAAEMRSQAGETCKQSAREPRVCCGYAGEGATKEASQVLTGRRQQRLG